MQADGDIEPPPGHDESRQSIPASSGAFAHGGRTLIRQNDLTTEGAAAPWAPLERTGSLPRDAMGPMGWARKEIRDARERFAIEQRERRRTASLVEETDRLLATLEELNLLRRKQVPARMLLRLEALIAELPWAYERPVRPGMSPTSAIDVVFEVQEGLLRSITGADAEDHELLDMAS